MKTNIARIWTLMLFLSAFGLPSMAQLVMPVDFMRYNPRNVYANPSFYTSDLGYFDLAVGGITFNLQNIGLKYDNFFVFNEQGKPVILDLNKGVESLKKDNYINTFTNVDILAFGFRARHGFFTFSHRFREKETFHYNKQALEFLVKGNASFMGPQNPAKVDFGIAVKAYQEFNFGYQMCLTERLNLGARVKLLMGYADVQSSAIQLQLLTDPQTYAMTVTGDVGVRAALPYEVSMQHGDFSVGDSRFDLTNLFRNYGAGIDLGAEYQINDEFGVAAALNDVGLIHWNNNAVKFKGGIENGGSLYHDGAFVFSGLTSDQIDDIIDDPGAFFENMMDSLGGYYDLSSEPSAYFSGLNSTVMLRGYYDCTPHHRFSAQWTGYESGIGLRSAVTLAYTGSFLNRFDVVTTYTMMSGSYLNLGLGLSANLNGFLLYAGTNNVFGFVNPANSSNISVQMGIAYTAGGKTDRKERLVMR